MVYRSLVRPILFRLPPETAHELAMRSLSLLKPRIIRSLVSHPPDPPALRINRFNHWFANPVGLAAGFDKNALYLTELEALGFGFVEIGTVTPKSQAGTDKPRLFRLPKDKALINRMGFNNDGVQVVAQRLKDWREKQAASRKLQAASQEKAIMH